MNQQQQIDIIQAHMDGKRVMVRDEDLVEWVELSKGEYTFDFRHREYKIEPRRVELFMRLPSGVLRAMARDTKCSHEATISNYPGILKQEPPGMVTVQINYLEP